MDGKGGAIDGGRPFDWGRASADYARYRDIYPPEFYQVLLDRGLCTAGQRVLDVGTGTGVLPRALYRYGAAFTGTDPAPEQIAQARRLAAEGVRPDVICVDPPRKGLAGDVVDTIADMAPDRVVYVSCDPATLGRDVKRFAQHGYLLQQAQAVDIFPRTQHVETIVLLQRETL